MHQETGILRLKLLAELVIVVIIIGGAFLFFHWSFTHEYVIPGIDGPYYLLQVRSILATGDMKYGDPPLTFYLLAGFAILFESVERGVEIGVSALASVSTLPLYFLMKKVTRHQIAAYSTLVVSLFTYHHVRMVVDLMKNAAGIIFLTVFLYLLYEAAVQGAKKRNIILSTIAITLAALTHILDLGFMILFSIIYSALLLAHTRRVKTLIPTLIPLTTIALIGVSGAAFLPFYFSDFNKGIYFGEELVSNDIDISGPKSPPPTSIQRLQTLPFMAAGMLLAIHLYRRGEQDKALLIGAASIVSIILALPFIPPNWSWRFDLMQFIPISIIVGVLLSGVREYLPAAGIAAIVILPMGIHAYQVAASMKPTVPPRGYEDLLNMKSSLPPDSVIVVPHKGVAYWVEYILSTPTANRLEPSLVKYENILILGGEGIRVPIPLKATLLFRGYHYNLYILPEPRR